MTHEDVKIVDILLVEDNPGDADLARETLKAGKIKNNLYVVSDGEKAMDFLRKKGPYALAPRPDIILLDLNLPRKDGREVLAEIKQDDKLKRIPVVILTSSQADEDVIKSYDLHANCYITKPLDFFQFTRVVQSIENFWLSIVKLPNGNK
jgi:two-component system, chemotaxis family, response regulator Rcp1